MYSETDSRHLRVAHYDPRDPPVLHDYTSAREAAELFGDLVIVYLHAGAEIATVEAWARNAAKYGRLALEARDAAIREFGREICEADTAVTEWLGGYQPVLDICTADKGGEGDSDEPLKKSGE